MFVFGHLGMSLATAYVVRRDRLTPRSLGWIGFAGLVPDLVDKSLALFVVNEPTSRLWAHSVIVQAAGIGAARLLRPFNWLLASMLPLHVAGDAAESWTVGSFLWPLFGFVFPASNSMAYMDDPLGFFGFQLREAVGSPLSLSFEAFGLAATAVVIARVRSAHGTLS